MVSTCRHPKTCTTPEVTGFTQSPRRRGRASRSCSYGRRLILLLVCVTGEARWVTIGKRRFNWPFAWAAETARHIRYPRSPDSHAQQHKEFHQASLRSQPQSNICRTQDRGAFSNLGSFGRPKLHQSSGRPSRLETSEGIEKTL